MFKLNKENIIKGIILTTLITGTIFATKTKDELDKSKVSELLNLLYDFSNVEEITRRHDTIQEMVSEDIFNHVTSLDRTLRAYLQMEGNPCSINITEVGDDYILYELSSKSLTEGRKFIVLYEVNLFGKITRFKEMEIVSFI